MRRPGQTRAALTLAVVVGALVGIGGDVRAQEPDVLTTVQSMLDERVAAVRAGDRERFLATVDPQASTRFRDEQLRTFEGLHALPLTRFELEARLDTAGNLASPAGLAARYGGAATFLPETRMTTQLRDVDDRPAVESLWLTFVERDGRWHVGGDGDLDALGLQSSKGIWDFGPVTVASSAHFLVLSHPDRASRARELLGLAEEAHAVLAERWDRPWSGRIPIVLPSSVDELERILQSTVDLDKFVAFVAYGVDRDDGRFAATAPRLYVQDTNLAEHSRAFQLETIVHELVHAATAPAIGPAVPAWVHEGLADWVARGKRSDLAKPPGGDGRLPRDHEFTTGTQASIVRSYREATAAVSALAGRSGPGAPAAVFAAIGEAGLAPGSKDHVVDEALRRAAGLSLADLARLWAA